MIVHVKSLDLDVSTQCNPTVVESLLPLSKEKIISMVNGKPNDSPSSYTRTHVNRGQITIDIVELLELIKKAICSGSQRPMPK